jgi:glycosyltransferase involved in cell wall biosynthesis/fido (protein-threonine AMPylation protein)
VDRLAGLAERVDRQHRIIDARLSRPARWRGPLRRELLGRGGTDERARVAAAYDWLGSELGPKQALDLSLLLELHSRAVGGGELRRSGVRVGRNAEFPPAADLGRILAEVLQRAVSGVEPVPLVAARLHLELLLAHPFSDGNGRVARLMAAAALMREGYRSTLMAAVEQHTASDVGAYGRSFARLAESGPSGTDTWLATALETMLGAAAPAAWFRHREDRLREALTRLGIEGRAQDMALSDFDRGRRRRGAAFAAMLQVTEPWPVLAPRVEFNAEMLVTQLRRLRAEESDEQAGPLHRPPLRPDRTLPDVGDPPSASVVVPAFQAAGTIARCLRGLRNQDTPEPFEVIVIASGDAETGRVVREQFPWVLLLEATGRLSPGACRNLGVEQAGGSFIAFLAADCVPDPDWLRRRLAAHREGNQMVGGFIDVALPSTLAGWAQYVAKFWGMLRFDGVRQVGGGPLFHLSYQRRLLDAFGPFPEGRVAGEDTSYNDNLVRAGHRILFDSAIRVRHINSRTWAEVSAGQREQGLAVGAACRDGRLSPYYASSLAGGPLAPLHMLARAVAQVGRRRPRWLARTILSLPLLLAAVLVRRRAFRRAFQGRVTPEPMDLDRSVTVRIPSPAGPPPLVSVIVPAYNEVAVIGACLDSVLAQTCDRLEVIVVDDESTDRTADLAETRGVRVLRLPHRGPASAKNAGGRAARGRVLVFIDADLRLEPTCIERLTEPILANRAIGTFTKDILPANPEHPWSLCWTLNRGVAPGRYMPDGFPERWGNFRAVEREAFLAAGGYDDVGYGEDMTLAPKLGALATAVPGARMRHRNPDNLSEIWQNAVWVGSGPRMRERRPSRHPLRRLFRRHSLAVARRYHVPRFVVFAFVYDLGLLAGSVRARLRPRHHWK